MNMQKKPELLTKVQAFFNMSFIFKKLIIC